MLRQQRSRDETAIRSQHTASSVSLTHRRESVGCTQPSYLRWLLRVAAALAIHAPSRLRESSPQPYAYKPHDLPAELRKRATRFSDAACVL